MVDSPRRTVLLALAVLCVMTPVWAPALDITGREYQYRAALVTVEDERVRVVGDHPHLAGFDGIDCFHERFPSRRCGFESRLIDESSIRAPYPNVRHVSGDPSLATREQYVAFAGHGQVFERTTQWNDSAGAYVLGLARVGGSEVLEEKARPVDQHARPIRQTVRTGSAWADEPLSEPVLVTSSGRYYVVYTGNTRSSLSEKPLTERVFELLSIGVGLVLFDRARRDSRSSISQ